MRKLENEEMRELEKRVQAISLHQRRLTLPKFQTLAKCIPLKVTHLSFRKETEEIIKRLGGFLMKKCCEEGGGSL